jgi:hypothetical protein
VGELASGLVDTSDLVAIELIKQLKARYCRLIDERDWPRWSELFTDDCTVQYTSRVLVGRDAVVAYAAKALAGSTSIHISHLPEIDLTAPGQAVGIWAMFDYVEGPGFRLNGFGRYYESYEKAAAGQWRIASLRLVRARVDMLPPLA